MTIPHPEIPRLPAELVNDGKQLRVWCEYCGRKGRGAWHYHGLGYGDRAAHCTNPESPYRDSGYWLTPAPGDAP